MKLELGVCFSHRIFDFDVNVGGRAEHVAEECEKGPPRPEAHLIFCSFFSDKQVIKSQYVSDNF